jgi:hypothetical protein
LLEASQACSTVFLKENKTSKFCKEWTSVCKSAT